MALRRVAAAPRDLGVHRPPRRAMQLRLWVISHNRKLMMLIRILRVVLLLLWLELGIALIVLPWHAVWDVNYFPYRYPALALLVKNPYFCGLISGLGVINVLLALDEFRRRTAAVVART